jgi:hypothetical protein
MDISASRGNNPELWQKILMYLDDRLQLGLLDRLRRVSSYELSEPLLSIIPGSSEDERYLKKDAVLQQLRVLAADALGVTELSIQIQCSGHR